MEILDAFLGEWRWYRRLRGGRWLHVFHAPSTFDGWLRQERPDNAAYHLVAAEDYRIPRARALP